MSVRNWKEIINRYEISDVVRACSLVHARFWACKHGCDVLDSSVFLRKEFVKAEEYFIRVYMAS